jgi:hypothetical protein
VRAVLPVASSAWAQPGKANAARTAQAKSCWSTGFAARHDFWLRLAMSASSRSSLRGISICDQLAQGKQAPRGLALAPKACNASAESNGQTQCGLQGQSARCSRPNVRHEYPVQIQEPEFGTAVQARLGPKERPNPSIEGTASGLRPPAAPHVKR